MNKLDLDYQNLLKDILENGTFKNDRTGTGTYSVFGRQIRHKMSDGFPLLTSKKVHFKSIVSELLWFLQSRTDLRWLLEHGNTIWVGDAYKRYSTIANSYKEPDYYVHVDDPNKNCTRILTKDEFIDRIKKDDKFSNEFGNLGKIYGYQWRNWEGTGLIPINIKDEDGEQLYVTGTKYIDQIKDVIETLKTNPDSRRMLVTALRPDQLSEMILPPCHYAFQFYTRELSLTERRSLISQARFNMRYSSGTPNSLSNIECDEFNVPKRTISLMFNMRSNDVPLGLPFNIASYGLLLEIIGKMVNMIPDELIGNLGDCHIYANQIDGVKEQLTRTSFELPKLNINTEFWPTESGECGIGEIDAIATLNSFSDENFCKCLLEEDIQLYNYKSHPKINFPLSN